MRIGSKRAFGAVAAAFAATMLGTTLPTPLYPLYQREMHFGAVLTTVIFATYAAGVVAGLFVFGRLSDRAGRKRLLLPGMILSALSAAAFLSAHGLPLIFAGRILSGLSAGIFTGTATAYMVELHPSPTVATMLAVAANIGGLSLGPLVAGVAAQYGPYPLRLPYALDLALLVPAFAGLALAPETVRGDRRFVWRFQRLRVPTHIRGIFVRAAIAGICGFCVSGLFSAIAPSFLSQILHRPNHALAGALVFTLFALSAIGQVTVNRIPKTWALAVACIALAAGIAFLAASIAAGSAALLFFSAVVAGFGQGLAIGFGLAEINERVEQHRGEVASTYFIFLYIGLAVPVIGAGFAAQSLGLRTAGFAFCAVVGLAVIAVLASLSRMRA